MLTYQLSFSIWRNGVSVNIVQSTVSQSTRNELSILWKVALNLLCLTIRFQHFSVKRLSCLLLKICLNFLRIDVLYIYFYQYSAMHHWTDVVLFMFDRFGNLIERLVGSGSSSLIPPLQTLPEQPIGKVYNPFAINLLDSRSATIRGRETWWAIQY